MKAALRYILSLLLVFAAVAACLDLIAPQLPAWYATLALPDFTPPSWIFAPVCLILYFLMAIALARVWGLGESIARRQWLMVFGLQIICSILCMLLFFSFHALFLSVFAIVILWFVGAILTLKSYDLDRLSFWLLVPYFAWITFAMILCAALWWIN